MNAEIYEKLQRAAYKMEEWQLRQATIGAAEALFHLENGRTGEALEALRETVFLRVAEEGKIFDLANGEFSSFST